MMSLTNYDLRMRMRKVLKPNMQVLLVIALIVSLPGLIANTVSILTNSSLTNYLLTLQLDTTSPLYTGDEEALMAALSSFLRERGWISLAATLAQWLISPALTLGFINAWLTLLRGGTAVVSTALSRLSSFGKAVLLFLAVTFKTVLWMLPGMAVMTAATVLAVTTGSSGLLMSLVGLSPALVGIPAYIAYYRYVLAMFFLADEPETGVLACVRRSKAVMKNRKLQLFSLRLPYLVGNMLALMISSLLTGVFGATLSMLVQLVLMVYDYGAQSAFYEQYTRPASQQGGTTVDLDEMQD